MGEINESKKGLGKPNVTPEFCPVCMERMSEKGWMIYGYTIYCYACRNQFVSEHLINDKTA